jgi:hypothetical protein
MTLNKILELLKADALCLSDPDCVERNFEHISATDLMSDALALVQSDSEKTILVTGLVHAQSLRTAEMLDINVVIYVRGKTMSDTDYNLAKEMGMNVFTTKSSMYDTCGILYSNGLLTAVV